MKKLIKLNRTILFTFILLFLHSCTKDKTSSTIDSELYQKALVIANFTWYKHSDTLLPISAGSGHSFPLLRTRFNDIASNKLDANGKVLSNTEFDEGSLIIKELFENQSTLKRYAILYKKSDSKFADQNGWVWGYINSDGSVVVSAESKGNSCINCHSQNGNIDYVLMNQYFP